MNVPTLSHTITALSFDVALAALAGPTLAQAPRPDRVVVFGTSLSDPGSAFAWLGGPDNRGCGTHQNIRPFDVLDDLLVPHEKAIRKSWPHCPQRARAKPRARMPHSRLRRNSRSMCSGTDPWSS